MKRNIEMKPAPNKNRVKFNRNKIKEPTPIEPQIKVLMISSIILWFISLPMVGFYADADYFGWFILLLSPLAWIGLPAGLAVYANFFYWWIVFSLMLNQKPKTSILFMVGLALLTITLREVPRGESGSMATVYAWGYGAFIWVFAIILMAGAVWDTRPFYSIKQILAPYFIAFLVILLSLFGLKYWQWSNANIYEKERYFPDKQVAFGVFTPSGIHYENQPFPKDLPNIDTPIEVEGNVILHKYHIDLPSLNAGHQYFSLPDQFLYRGYKISKIDRVDRIGGFYIIEKSNVQPFYRYQIQEIGNEKLRLSLYDLKQQREIWYGEANKDKNIATFDKQIKGLFKTSEYSLPNKILIPKSVNFTHNCPTYPIPPELNQGDTIYLQLDDKLTWMSKNHSKLFCQDNIALLIYEVYNDPYPYIVSNIIQRDNLIELAWYEIRTDKQPELQKLYQKYPNNFISHIQSASLSENGLIIRSEFGETLLPIKK